MINRADVMGRVGKMDARCLPNGTPVTNLSIATNKKILKDAVKVDKVTWHNITLYGKLSEIATQIVNVGDLLFITGEIENQKFTDATGVEKTRSFINGHQLQKISSANSNPPKPKQDSVSSDSPGNFKPSSEFLDDGLPF